MFFLYNFFACLILSEKRILDARIRYLADFFHKINLIKFVIFIFNRKIHIN